MAFNVQDFISNGLVNQGARPSLFDVTINIPSTIGASNPVGVTQKLQFTVRAASLPPATLEAVEIPYFGRKIKVAGDRTFPDWTVTVMNDEDFIVRQTLELWSNAINSLVSNLRLTEDYTSQATVRSYAKRGSVISSYDFVALFPKDVGQMQVDWEDTNRIQTFDVTFAYTLWTPSVSPNPAVAEPATTAPYTGTETTTI